MGFVDVLVGAMDAAVMVAEAAHRQQLHTIKAAALVNLAYLQLQQQQWQQAVVYSQQLLQVGQLAMQSLCGTGCSD